ncbi:glycerol-3-phosphate dehydrogenase/oxidase [Leptospira ognonensis]|uniref:Glycerol-3-phosphate dehydrogenase/oxidase n=1 Tax=Leptospira ognonensis TaxID=2484945 RepID=A0A4R9K6C3_9LEPT|nr:glycerol-3-phosphate dehydrogenase/oxidase [Leptospira ognonensis]TGL61808.1 glycerol-3-phosphate dehydrogenase/oxidase [Leptospira ognonensis]
MATKNKKSRLDEVKNDYDIVIIGGGITGANILWDATLRGFKCLLVEKSDYASGTSQATSKLIHGGLRYLKNLEFSLVRESLRERRILGKISPHGVRTLGFIIPIHSLFERLLLWAGMFLYNLLAFDRNRQIIEDCLIPRYTWNSKPESIYKSPALSRDNLLGSFQYYDYLNVNPEHHTSEFIFSAKAREADAFNYMQVTSIAKQNSGGYLVGIKDNISNEAKLVSTKVLINSAGPWADFIEALAGIAPEKKLLRSKGIHVVVRNICSKECIILQKKDGSHLFVIPWRNKTIVGTTDTVYDENPENFKVKESEIKSLLEEVNSSFGLANLTLADVDYYYGGLRPLVEDLDSKKDTYSASRKSEILHYTKEGFEGFFSALGGKYTTSRGVAEKLVDQVSIFLKNQKIPCATSVTPLLGGDYASKQELVKILYSKYPKQKGVKLETLADRYGMEAIKILGYKGIEEYILPNGEPFYEEEIEYAVKNEDIIHATDFYFRRSGSGTLGRINEQERKKMDAKLAKHLGWSSARLKSEAIEVDKRYLWAKG